MENAAVFEYCIWLDTPCVHMDGREAVGLTLQFGFAFLHWAMHMMPQRAKNPQALRACVADYMFAWGHLYLFPPVVDCGDKRVSSAAGAGAGHYVCLSLCVCVL